MNSNFNQILQLSLTTIFFSVVLLGQVGIESLTFEYILILLVIIIFISLLQPFLRVNPLTNTYAFMFFRLSLSWLIVFSFLSILGFITKSNESVSRVIIGTSFLSTLIFDLIKHSYVFYFYRKIKSKEKIVIINESGVAQDSYSSLGEIYEVSKIIELSDNTIQEVLESEPQHVLIDLSVSKSKNVLELRDDLLNYPFRIVWSPMIDNFNILDMNHTTFSGFSAINLSLSELFDHNINIFIKRSFDFLIALFLLFLLSPLLLLVALLIKTSSKGPIIFKQERHGLYGEVFKMWKFRSMKIHDTSEYVQTTKNDTRVTAIGKFIRKYSIDELPQLFNVIFGQMSLVGPRPHAVEINRKYDKKIDKFMSRHRAKPGITGLAQINGYRGGDDLESMKMRTFYDLKYLNNWSLYLDLKILLKTPIELLKKDVF